MKSSIWCQSLFVFVRLRQVLESNRDLDQKIKQLERDLTERADGQDEKIAKLFEALKQLIQKPVPVVLKK